MWHSVFKCVYILLIFLIESRTTESISGNCPNNCNSQGLCDKYSRCACTDGYTGADCSLKLCPYGNAWSDQATASDTAHAFIECSSRGTCDRESGECVCAKGFTGSACERLECSNDCNGNGICLSMKDRAAKTR